MIMWAVFITAISLGLVSSFHCIGMCGPLALSLPLQSLSAPARTLALITYHAGRLLIYTTLGAIFGLLGRRIYLAGFQQVFSITLGSLILLHAILIRSINSPQASRIIKKLYQPLQQLITTLWQSPGRRNFFLLGMANGLLPCGMVYLAIAGALSFGHIGESIAFMLFFGAGTLPALLLLSFSGRLIGINARVYIKKAIPGLVAIMGMLLILRGLDLGIPFISPALAHNPAHPVSCH
jgi:sulfite exporter TauE/SafE